MIVSQCGSVCFQLMELLRQRELECTYVDHFEYHSSKEAALKAVKSAPRLDNVKAIEAVWYGKWLFCYCSLYVGLLCLRSKLVHLTALLVDKWLLLIIFAFPPCNVQGHAAARCAGCSIRRPGRRSGRAAGVCALHQQL